MAVNERISGWFKDEFEDGKEEGKTGDQLRIHMYKSESPIYNM